MQYGAIVDAVQREAALSSMLEADRATQATLRVLTLRLSAGPLPHVANHLPLPLAAEFVPERGNRPFGIQEFYARVATRCATDPTSARHRARAVIAVLRSAMPDALRDADSLLTGEYEDLLAPDVRISRP